MKRMFSTEVDWPIYCTTAIHTKYMYLLPLHWWIFGGPSFPHWFRRTLLTGRDQRHKPLPRLGWGSVRIPPVSSPASFLFGPFYGRKSSETNKNNPRKALLFFHGMPSKPIASDSRSGVAGFNSAFQDQSNSRTCFATNSIVILFRLDKTNS